MDIKELWQQNVGGDDALNDMLQYRDWSKIQSHSPLNKLKNNLLTGILSAGIITAFYIYLLVTVDIWQVNTALVILIVFNSWVSFDSWKLHKTLNFTTVNSLKEELKRHCQSFERWRTLQERAGLFVYPIALTGGFLLGGVEGSGKSVESFLYNPRMLLFLGITILIFVPICYYLARWMFKYIYGKHLNKLKALIKELDEDQ